MAKLLLKRAKANEDINRVPLIPLTHSAVKGKLHSGFFFDPHLIPYVCDSRLFWIWLGNSSFEYPS